MLEIKKNRATQEKRCCKKKSTWNQITLAALIILSLLVLILIICVIINRDHSTQDQVCIDEGCVVAAATVLKYIDQSVDPCDDFYEFACGNFQKNAYRDNDASPFKTIDEKFQHDMKGIIVDTPNKHDKPMQTVVKQFYQACINQDAIDADNTTSFFKIIKKLGGWPLVEWSWINETNFDWAEFAVEAAKAGLSSNSFFSIGKYEEDDADTIIPKIDVVSPVNTKKIKQGDIFYSAMRSYIGSIANSIQERYNDTDLDETLYFLKKLKKICDEYNSLNTSYQVNTLSNLTEDCPSIPLHKILDGFVNILDIQDNIYFVENDSFVAYKNITRFCVQLNKLLSSTSKRTQANYLIWKIFDADAALLSLPIRVAQTYYLKNVFGIPPMSTTERCYLEASVRFNHVKETLYIRKLTSDRKIRKELTRIIKHIQAEFKKLLEKSDWMDPTTKSFAIGKIRNVSSFIGFTDVIYDKGFDIYLGMNFTLNSSNIIDIITTRRIKHIQLLVDLFYAEKLGNWDIIFENAVKLNAFFSQTSNFMVLPAPILQDLFYNVKFPAYMNYGSMGRIIGHELMHGFQESARFITADDGKQIDWWTNNTANDYRNKVQCVVDLYENFKDKLNGTQTLDENVSDFVGIDAAYLAYKRRIHDRGTEKKLPGLNYTPEQVYWIQANTFLCYKKVTDIAYDLDEPDEHGIPTFRINAPLQNSLYFAKDFNCPVGSPMNPKKKCRVL